MIWRTVRDSGRSLFFEKVTKEGNFGGRQQCFHLGDVGIQVRPDPAILTRGSWIRLHVEKTQFVMFALVLMKPLWYGRTAVVPVSDDLWSPRGGQNTLAKSWSEISTSQAYQCMWIITALMNQLDLQHNIGMNANNKPAAITAKVSVRSGDSPTILEVLMPMTLWYRVAFREGQILKTNL